MNIARYSRPMVALGIGLIALAGLGLIQPFLDFPPLLTVQPLLALKLAVSLGVAGLLLIISGCLFADLEVLRRRAERTDKDLGR